MTARSEFFQCSQCNLYFETYSKATFHLGLNHSADLIKKLKLNGNNQEDKGIPQQKQNLIITHLFPEVSILVEKLKRQEIEKLIDKKQNAPTGNIPQKSLTKMRNRQMIVPGRLEIKLDTLKASEIETLIQDLYSAASNSKSSNSIGGSGKSGLEQLRKSNRKVTPQFPKSYGELDSEVEEIIRIGSGQTKRRSKFESVSLYSESSRVKLSSNRSKLAKNGDKRRTRNKLKVKESLEVNDKNLILDNTLVLKNGQKNECEICRKKFTSLKELKKHKISHKREMPCKSPISQKVFNCNDYVKQRLKIHLEDNPFVCEIFGCGKKLSSEYHLRRHVVALHTNRELFKCKLCSAVCSTKDRLQEHFKKWHSENSKLHADGKVKVVQQSCVNRPISIKGAGQRYTNQTLIKNEQVAQNKPESDDHDDDIQLEIESVHLTDRTIITDDDQHSSIHVKDETLIPQESPNQSRSLSPTSSFENEGTDSDGTLPPKESDDEQDINKQIKKIPKIQKLLTDKPDIIKPVLKVNDIRKRNITQYKCQLCDWTSSLSYSFQKHMEKTHGQTDNVFHSAITEPRTSNDNSSESISLICGSCGYHSNSSKDLASHMSSSHIGVNKFHCSFCGQRFPSESRKAQHEKFIHITEKKYECNLCKAKYALQISLDTHKRNKHDPINNAKKFVCPKCNKILLTKKNYSAHMKLHSDSRPVVTCKMCGQHCSNIYSLRRHIQYVHLKVKNLDCEKRNIKRAKRRKQKESLEASESQEGNQTEVDLDAKGNRGNDDVPNTIENYSKISVQESDAIIGW